MIQIFGLGNLVFKRPLAAAQYLLDGVEPKEGESGEKKESMLDSLKLLKEKLIEINVGLLQGASCLMTQFPLQKIQFPLFLDESGFWWWKFRHSENRHLEQPN